MSGITGVVGLRWAGVDLATVCAMLESLERGSYDRASVYTDVEAGVARNPEFLGAERGQLVPGRV